MNGDIYVTRNLRGKWVVRVEGQHRRQRDAWAAALDIARRLGVEASLRGKNGRVRIKDSYGNDPRDVKG